MSRRRNGDHSWSGIRSVLSDSLKQVVVDPKDFQDLISVRWALIVGKEIAAVSQVNKVAPQTLYVDVAEKEWLPALEALRKKIIEEIKQQAGWEKLDRIIFKIVPSALLSRSPSSAPVIKNTNSNRKEFQGQSRK